MSDEYQRVWQDFVQSGRVLSVSGPLGATPNEGWLHLVYVLSLANDGPTVETARSLQRELNFPFVEAVPEAHLHISIQAMDLPRPVWTEHRDRIIAESAKALANTVPCNVRLGGVTSFPVAAVSEVYDDGRIRQMRARLRAAFPDLIGADPFVRDGQDTWLPHVSLAYYTAEHDNREVINVLGHYRVRPISQVTLNAIDLISEPTSAGSYHGRWVVEASFGAPSMGAT